MSGVSCVNHVRAWLGGVFGAESKTRPWLAAGTRAVVVIDPRRRSAMSTAPAARR